MPVFPSKTYTNLIPGATLQRIYDICLFERREIMIRKITKATRVLFFFLDKSNFPGKLDSTSSYEP